MATAETNWFESLGSTIPEENRELARSKAEEMGATMDAGVIDEIAEAIARDDPERAIETTCEELDLTGAYRLLAYLCVGPENS